MKPAIFLYEHGPDDEYTATPRAVANCREMLVSGLRHIPQRQRKAYRVVVDRPFKDRVASTNKVLRDYFRDSEEITVDRDGNVIIPRWIGRALPLLHAVLGLLRNPIPSHRVQLIAACTVLSEYEYKPRFDRLPYNGCQTFCLSANPDVWTPGALDYIRTLRSPRRTLDQLDRQFRSVILFNEEAIDIEHVLQTLALRFRSPEPLNLTISMTPFILRNSASAARITLANGALTRLSSLAVQLHAIETSEFGWQEVYLMPRELLHHDMATYPVTDGE